MRPFALVLMPNYFSLHRTLQTSTTKALAKAARGRGEEKQALCDVFLIEHHCNSWFSWWYQNVKQTIWPLSTCKHNLQGKKSTRKRPKKTEAYHTPSADTFHNPRPPPLCLSHCQGDQSCLGKTFWSHQVVLQIMLFCGAALGQINERMCDCIRMWKTRAAVLKPPQLLNACWSHVCRPSARFNMVS